MADPREEEWKGYLYVGVLTVTAMTQTLLLSQYNQRMFVVGMQIRTALTSTIYRKVLISFLFYIKKETEKFVCRLLGSSHFQQRPEGIHRGGDCKFDGR